VATTQNNLARTLGMAGERDAAEQLLRESGTRFARLGEPLGQATVQANLGSLRLSAGEAAAAEQELEAALGRLAGPGQDRQRASILVDLGSALLRQGRGEGLARLSEAVALAERTRSSAVLGQVTGAAAAVLAAAGYLSQTSTILEDVRARLIGPDGDSVKDSLARLAEAVPR